MIEAGRRVGVLSAGGYTERIVYTRMLYLRNSAGDVAWRRREMEMIARIFLDWIGMDTDGARALIASAPKSPSDLRQLPRSSQKRIIAGISDHLRPLGHAKTTLYFIELFGREYITGKDNEKIISWLDLAPELP